MYHPGDLTFTVNGSSVVKQKDLSYKVVGTGQTYSTFTAWWKEVEGKVGIYEIGLNTEDTSDPKEEITGSIARYKKCKTMGNRFDCGEEAWHICREVPELLILEGTVLQDTIVEMAMDFLLYDDIAAHPVWLHCAQEAVLLVKKVRAGLL
jgi:hypothetical protein